ncbi:MAG TPA: lysophospholipid acyltransferase family protein [Acidobacteriota bacterium]|nr:lysophospholipid acyltransferase family protein [Acidobacteriota bacterium]
MRYPVQCALTMLATVFWGSCALLISLVDRQGKWVHACAKNWGASIFRICNVQVQTEGKEKLDREGSYVVMSNHCSLFDIPTVLTSLPFPFRMLAKASLFRIPFMGWYMSRVGYIPVKRDDPKKARESIENAASRVASGLSVLIFPEGTRSVEGEVARFKRGGVNLAHTAAVSVVPVAIINSGRLLPRGSWHADPGVITMRIGDPINPENFSDPRALASNVRSAIVRMIEERRETV